MNKPGITLDFRKGRIRIHHSTLTLLGDPKYISLLVNPEAGVIAVTPAPWNDSLSHYAVSRQKGKNYLEISSMNFIKTLQPLNERFQFGESYRIIGIYNGRNNTAIFPVSCSEHLERKEVNTHDGIKG